MNAEQRGLLFFPIMIDLNAYDGIVKKNQGIISAFTNKKINIDTITFYSQGVFFNNKNIYKFSTNRLIRKLQYHVLSHYYILNQIKNIKYDFSWFRMGKVKIFFYFFLKKFKQTNPSKIILEYGAYPYDKELVKKIDKLTYKLELPIENKIHHLADFFITYSGQTTIKGKYNIPINNGIDMKDYHLSSPSYTSDVIQIISVSSLRHWHAVDRFLEGMIRYKESDHTKKIILHIVGDGPEREKLKVMVDNNDLKEQVIFHGFKTANDLDDIFKNCHLALSTLGFHRIGITNSSSLKNREYIARGLPVILSTQDKDLQDTHFFKYVPDDESPIQIPDIIGFYDQISRIEKVNQKIREYANGRVSWETKVEEVLQFINNK